MEEVININHSIANLEGTKGEGLLTFEVPTEAAGIAAVIVYLVGEEYTEIARFEGDIPQICEAPFEIEAGEEKTFLIQTLDAEQNPSEGVTYIVAYHVEEPVPPANPANLKVIVNDDVAGVSLDWDYDELDPDIVFHIYLNDEFTGAASSDTHIELQEMAAGILYTAKVKAVNTKTGLESGFSNETAFEIKGLSGSDDPNNWVGVRLDNITVIYHK